MENNICNSMTLTSRRRHFYLVGQSKHTVGACGVNHQASAVLAGNELPFVAFSPDGHGYELVSSVRALLPQKFSVEEELMHVKHVEVKSPHVGVMWKFGKGGYQLSKTDICGTLRPNRKGLPVSLKSSTLKKGEIIGFQKDKMCALKWKDKKPLHMLSTFHNADMMEVKARKGDSVKLKPKAVVFYYNSMGVVDRSQISVYLTILLSEINSENTTRRFFDIC
ncbi:piggyBac transposable element-derived protein 4 [Trichonephila clavipes]|nr:piggyBac transposable element-derived protein 4 [Trichonephila clavipes]